MSFDLDIETQDVDGNTVVHEVVCGHTYNLVPMWRMALRFESSSDLNGRICRELVPSLDQGLLHILNNEQDYLALNPENGWGDFEGFFEIFVRFARMCHRYPSGIVRWNG
jgi:hypothetical protein